MPQVQLLDFVTPIMPSRKAELSGPGPIHCQSWLQVHFPQQGRVARVGAQRIEAWIYVQMENDANALVDRLFEPVEAFVDFPESSVDHSKTQGQHIALLSEFLQFLEQFLRFAQPPCLRVRSAKQS